MTRLFVALNIPEEIKTKIINLRSQIAEGYNFKWEQKDKLHLTLKFIGNFEESRIRELIRDLKFIEDHSSFNCLLNKFDFFFRNRYASILWAGIKTENRITNLVDELDAFFNEYGIVKDVNQFKTHITLLRIKQDFPTELIEKFKNFEIPPIEFKCDSVGLYESQLSRSGSMYKEIKKYKLKND